VGSATPAPQAAEFSEAEIDRLTEDLKQRILHGGTLGDFLGVSQADLEATYIVGSRLYDMGNYKEAAITLRKLVTLDPFEKRYLQALAAATQMMGQHAQALGLYHMLLVLDAEDPMPTVHMAQCLIHLGRAQDAAIALEATIDNASGKPAFAAILAQAQAMHALIKQSSPAEAHP
jgi:type III secretion system low calcium response chaperone LcrH/SycD